MKTGDIAKYSDRNKDPLGRDVSAYAGMEGTIDEMWDDGSFYINCGTCGLTVSMTGHFGRKKGCVDLVEW